MRDSLALLWKLKEVAMRKFQSFFTFLIWHYWVFVTLWTFNEIFLLFQHEFLKMQSIRFSLNSLQLSMLFDITFHLSRERDFDPWFLFIIPLHSTRSRSLLTHIFIHFFSLFSPLLLSSFQSSFSFKYRDEYNMRAFAIFFSFFLSIPSFRHLLSLTIPLVYTNDVDYGALYFNVWEIKKKKIFHSFIRFILFLFPAKV